MAAHPSHGRGRGEHVLQCFQAIGPNLAPPMVSEEGEEEEENPVVTLWDNVIPKLLSYLNGEHVQHMHAGMLIYTYTFVCAYIHAILCTCTYVHMYNRYIMHVCMHVHMLVLIFIIHVCTYMYSEFSLIHHHCICHACFIHHNFSVPI